MSRERGTPVRWALRLGNLYGIAIRLHVTFLLLLAFLFLMATLAGGWRSGLRSLLLLVLVFVCVLLHELAHSYVSVRYGLRVRSITLLPLGGLALLEELPREARQGMPLSLGESARAFLPVLSGEALLASLFWSNLSIGLFNLLPAYPLDGGRVLRAWLSGRMDYVEATRRAVGVGQFFALLFVLGGLLLRETWPVVIGMVVFWAAMTEERVADVIHP